MLWVGRGLTGVLIYSSPDTRNSWNLGIDRMSWVTYVDRDWVEFLGVMGDIFGFLIVGKLFGVHFGVGTPSFCSLEG
jgi:hypothetical protein